MVAVWLGAVYSHTHPNRSNTLSSRPLPSGRGERLCGWQEAARAACQGRLAGRWEVNFPNFPNFLGTRKSGKFTVDD